MRRLATFQWHTPPPTSIDEELALYDDDSAWLAVRRPRNQSATIGTFSCQPDADDRRALTAAGAGAVEFDLLQVPGPETAVLMAVAGRVASACRATPNAIATFYARPLGAIVDGKLAMSLLVVAAGTRPVEFELDVAASSVHFSLEGQPVAWYDLPDLEVGFVTAEAKGLGGLRAPAQVPPGAFGAVAFDVAVFAHATAVSVQVAGWLRESLPGETMPQRFEVRTAEAPIGV